MKINKLQIRLIIGAIFLIIMYSLIVFLEPKENINNNTINQNINNEIDKKTLINMQNINITETENPDKGKEKNVTKDELFSLIEKGLQASSNVELFIYSTEFFNDDNFANIFYEGEYKEVISYINLSEYKGENFEFTTLRNTESYIWGSFLEEDKDQNEKTYIIIDKLSGRVKSLNSKKEQVVFYYKQ